MHTVHCSTKHTQCDLFWKGTAVVAVAAAAQPSRIMDVHCPTGFHHNTCFLKDAIDILLQRGCREVYVLRQHAQRLLQRGGDRCINGVACTNSVVGKVLIGGVVNGQK